MTTLLLRLAGPLQSWGSRSRFVRRDTERAPTKSGVIGLIAAARGMRRTDELTEFFGLRFGVRIDQPGRIVRDFQTARRPNSGKMLPLTFRQYLGDAVFLAGIEGAAPLLAGFEEALRAPVFAPYLGRRSCTPVLPLSLGVHEKDLVTTLREFEWQAAPWYRTKARSGRVRLEVLRDAIDGERAEEVVRDEPLSFDPARRDYGWRYLVREETFVANPGAVRSPEHEPMELLRED